MTLLLHRRESIFVKFTPHITLLNPLLLYLVCLPRVFFFNFCFFIIVAPLITTQPQSGSVTEGDNVTLSCNASGNPVPEISWTRDGSPVSSGDRRISFEAGNRQLTITNVSRADSGEYRCVADNSEGNDTSNATTLDVQCKYTSLIKDLTKLPKTEFLSARLEPRILAR